MNDKERKALDRDKIISNAITAALALLIVGIVALSLYVVLSPRVKTR
ncbi:MAG: hypothetical protein RSE00_01620 [Clostridia bacterium]